MKLNLFLDSTPTQLKERITMNFYIILKQECKEQAYLYKTHRRDLALECLTELQKKYRNLQFCMVSSNRDKLPLFGSCANFLAKLSRT